ncbi:MAG TPA: hypothetical protein EYO59_03360 [Chromatiaceae bacterium]|nr:hypothetical protein [Chromatiaceae bacterium]
MRATLRAGTLMRARRRWKWPWGPGSNPTKVGPKPQNTFQFSGGVLKAWSPLQRSDLFTDNVSELKDELVEERGEEWRRRGRDTSSFAEAYFPRFPHFRPKGDRERVRKFIEKVEDSFSAILEDLFVALKKFFDVDPQEWRPDQIRSKKAARTEQRSRRKAVFRKMPSRASLVEVAKTLAATTKEGKSSPSWYLDEGLTSVRAPNTQVGHLPTVKAFSLLGELLKLVEYQTGWKIVVNRKCFLWSMWTGEPPERWFEPVPMYLNFPRRKEYSHVSELDESEFGAKRSRPFLGSANYVKVESAHFAAHRSGRFDGLTAESKEELPKEDTQVFCFSVLAPRFVNMKFVLDLNEMEREVDAHTDEEEPLTEEDIEELKRSTLERSVWHQAEGDFVAVPLKFRSDFRQEGTSLRHCIGVDPKYFENYRKGNRSFYSLRSKSGKPKFTIEVTGKVGDFKRQILQVKGMNNRLPGFRDSECTGKFKRSEYDLVTSFIDEYIQDARRDVPDLECAERLIKEGVRPNPSFYPERTFGSLDDYYEEER